MKKGVSKYKRDKRSPQAKSETVSKVMSANKAKNSKPEILLRKALWNKGVKGYRLHAKTLPGRPDIVFISKRIAVFVNGCFWHRCPNCDYQLPKNNTIFWKNKFEKNILRDVNKITALEELGWNTVTIWECEIKTNLTEQVIKIEKLIYG